MSNIQIFETVRIKVFDMISMNFEREQKNVQISNKICNDDICVLAVNILDIKHSIPTYNPSLSRNRIIMTVDVGRITKTLQIFLFHNFENVFEYIADVITLIESHPSLCQT